MSDGSSADRATGDSSKKRKQSEGPEYIPKKCPHGRQKSLCKECGGVGICTHGRIPCKCKECGGGTYCIHGKRRTVCRECGGGSLCSHDRLRWECKECDGASICIHGRQKRICKECGGVGICTHGKRRTVCRECGGGSFCTHGKRRAVCKDCSSHLFCVHDRRKTRCKECGGSSMCTHGRQRSGCKECSSHLFCVHGRRPKSCKDCASATPSSSTEPGSAAAVVEPQVEPPTIVLVPASTPDAAGDTEEEVLATWETIGVESGGAAEQSESETAEQLFFKKKDCEHGSRYPYDCFRCFQQGHRPSAYCKHNIQRKNCKVCGGKSLCVHGIRKFYCVPCGGNGMCSHSIRRESCKVCKHIKKDSVKQKECKPTKKDNVKQKECKPTKKGSVKQKVANPPSVLPKPTSPQQESEYDSEDYGGVALSRTCAHCNKDLDIAHFGMSVGGEHSPHCNDCAYEIQRRDTPLGAAARD